MPDLDSELKRLATAMVDEAPDAPSFAAVTTPTTSQSRRSRRPMRAAALVAAGMLLVVVAIIVAVLASPNDSAQQPAGPTGFAPCTMPDPGPFVGPDGKTFGPVVSGNPDTDGTRDSAALPDYIPVTCRKGIGIGGWIKKQDMLTSPSPASPAPEDIAKTPPDIDPVYADDGTTIVGHMYDNIGFVPLGEDPASVSTVPVHVETH
jgi:hypothetical protein